MLLLNKVNTELNINGSTEKKNVQISADIFYKRTQEISARLSQCVAAFRDVFIDIAMRIRRAIYCAALACSYMQLWFMEVPHTYYEWLTNTETIHREWEEWATDCAVIDSYKEACL